MLANRQASPSFQWGLGILLLARQREQNGPLGSLTTGQMKKAFARGQLGAQFRASWTVLWPNPSYLHMGLLPRAAASNCHRLWWLPAGTRPWIRFRSQWQCMYPAFFGLAWSPWYLDGLRWLGARTSNRRAAACVEWLPLCNPKFEYLVTCVRSLEYLNYFFFLIKYVNSLRTARFGTFLKNNWRY